MNLERLKKLLARENTLPEDSRDAELIADLEAQISQLEAVEEEAPKETEEIEEENEEEAEEEAPKETAEDKRLASLESKLEKLLEAKKPKVPQKKEPDAVSEIQKELILLRAKVPEVVHPLIPKDLSPSELKEYLKKPEYAALVAAVQAPKRPSDPTPKGKLPQGKAKAKPAAPKKWNDIGTADLSAFDSLFLGDL